MNDIAKGAIMEKLAHKIEVEKLTNKAEIGRVLGINGTYLSMILNIKTWDKCPKSAWEAVLNWLNSGYTLSQYKEKYPVKKLDGVKVEKSTDGVNYSEVAIVPGEQPVIRIKPGVLEARQKVLSERANKGKVKQLSDFPDQEIFAELRLRGYSGTLETKKLITI